jgi:hypothetical protein
VVTAAVELDDLLARFLHSDLERLAEIGDGFSLSPFAR